MSKELSGSRILGRNSSRNIQAEGNENEFENPVNLLSFNPLRTPLNTIQDPSLNPRETVENSSDSRVRSERNRFGRFLEKKIEDFDSEQRFSDYLVPTNKGIGNGVSNYGTPRTARGKAHSEPNSAQSTPVRSVSRVSNIGSCTVSRPPQYSGPRGSGFSKVSRGISNEMCWPSVEVPHFELTEDSSFWMDRNVQVLVRIRPVTRAEKALQGGGRCLRQESSQTLTWLGHPETRFTFDHIACETISQEKLFKVAGLPMVENCMSGYNSCMFAYGQTGSGKTYTMMGEIYELDNKLSDDCGMTPRIFEYLLTRIKAEEEKRKNEKLQYSCKCSFLEIYNEQITDLLEPSSINLQLREDMKKGVYVENLKEYEVTTVMDVVELLLQGAANRKMAATHMNSESSRSHSVFTCVIESRWEKDSMTHLRFGRLNLVDLAGSESLVIMTLVDVAHGKHRHVPYRDSRLTFLLQDSLGGNSKTTIIANVSPSVCAVNETLSTLKFAQRAKLIQNNAKVNEDASGDVMALQQQIHRLKNQLTFLLKHPNISQPLSFCSSGLEEVNSGDFHEDYCSSLEGDIPVPVNYPSISNKKIKYLQATLIGTLRREKTAESAVKMLEAEIEHMNRLVHQREEDAQRTKMILRFREEKIRRLELLADGLVSGDEYLMEENNVLSEEIQLLRVKIDRNPELTQFALENLRLLEQLRMFQGFYEQGEREMLLAEVSELRDQVDNSLLELEDCKKNLGASLETNARLTREIDDLSCQLKKALNCAENTHHTVPNFLPRDDDVTGNTNTHTSVDLSIRAESEERIESCKVEDKLQSITNNQEAGDAVPLQNMDARKELTDGGFLLDAMKLQQVHLIEELDNLRQENSHYLKLLRSNVHNDIQSRIPLETHCEPSKGHRKAEELGHQDADPMAGCGAITESALQAKLERMHRDLEEAKILNRRYQCDQASQLSRQHEIEQVREEVELETAKTIIYLQGELAALQQEVESRNESESSATTQSLFLRTENQELQERLCIMTQENIRLSNTLSAKDGEISALIEGWEKAILDLTSFLLDGYQSLEDASDQIEGILNSFPQKNFWIGEQVERAMKVFIEKERVIGYLQKKLEDAQRLGLEMKLKLSSLKGATLAISEVQQLENNENVKEVIQLRASLLEKMSLIQELEIKLKNKEDQIVEAERCSGINVEQEQALLPEGDSTLALSDHNTEEVQRSVENLSHADATLPCLREVESALSCLRKIHGQLSMLFYGKEVAKHSYAQGRHFYGSLACDSDNPQLDVDQKEDQLSMLEIGQLLQKYELKVKDAEAGCCKAREMLCLKINGSRLVAGEKMKLANNFLLKLEEGQQTMKEADLVLNALLKVNENAKQNNDRWRQAGEELIVERNALMKEVHQLKASIHLQKEQSEFLQGQIHASSVEIVNSVSSLEDSFIHVKSIVEEEFKVIYSDIFSFRRELLDCIGTSRSWLEDMWSEMIEKGFSLFVLYQCHLGAFSEIMSMDLDSGFLSRGQSESCSLPSNVGSIFVDVKGNNSEFKGTNDGEEGVHREHSKYRQSASRDIPEVLDVSQVVEHIPFGSHVDMDAVSCKWPDLALDLKSSLERVAKLEEEKLNLTYDIQLIREAIMNQLIYIDAFSEKLTSFLEISNDADFSITNGSTEIGKVVGKLLHDKESISLDTCHSNIFEELGLSSYKTRHHIMGLVINENEATEGEIGSILTDGNDLFTCIQNLKTQCAQLISLIAEKRDHPELLLPHKQGMQENSVGKHNGMLMCSHEAGLLNCPETRTENGGHSIEALSKLGAKLSCITSEVHSLGRVETEYKVSASLLETIFQGICSIEEKACRLIVSPSRKEDGQADVISENLSLKTELTRNYFLLEGLLFDFRLLQESTSKTKDIKDENQQMMAALSQAQLELAIKTSQLDDILIQHRELEACLADRDAAFSTSKSELEQSSKALVMLANENSELRALLDDLYSKKTNAEDQLEEKKKVVKGLEGEILRLSSSVEESILYSVEEIEDELRRVSGERDQLRTEVTSLNDKLELLNAVADENEAIAVEARQVSEVSKIYAEQKEEEAKILERSVEELECTINVLEKKVYEMGDDVERHRLMREKLELELQALGHRMLTVENVTENLDTENSDVEEIGKQEMPRKFDDRVLELHEASRYIGILEKERADQSEEIKRLGDYVSEVVLHAEAQASQYQQRYKILESMVHEAKTNRLTSNAAASTINKTDRSLTRTRRSGSPFKCIASMVQQMNSEKDQELSIARLRIEELESLAATRQKEVCMLTARLAATESMTHDVIRDLLGVKLDITNYANLIDQQEFQKLAEKVMQQTEESNIKDQEILMLRQQVDDFIDERDSWIEEINQRQEDILAAQLTAEQLQQRDQLLVAQNEVLKMDKANLKRKIVELEEVLKKHGGSQKTRQLVHHPIKIKENSSLRVDNEALTKRLAHSEKLLSCVNDELALYCKSTAKDPYVD
ncbi:phragmoplast orienting kinesin 1 isoform X2 [Tasmannia lanceolata]|uniref:phragmoplast orienting kinesin 1 isoform X2 n=1 Tax=Tasmannia lanceolata TaxID=3420 RepID=UPI004064BBC7